jgi:hypothetical protein
MLTFPAIQDRLIVLASGLIMAAGLAFIVNRMRVRSEKKKRTGA